MSFRRWRSARKAVSAALAAAGWRVVAVDRCADDPALPYRLGSRGDLDRVVEEARAAAGDDAAGDMAVVAAQADTRDPEALAAAVRTPVIASGGVGGLKDLERLATLPIAGCIVGRALYEGRFSLADAIERSAAIKSARPED